jgi:hypothetical protein
MFDAPRHAGRGAATTSKEIEVQQYANPIDAPPVVLTRSGATWLQNRLAEEESHIATLDREMAVMAALRAEHETTLARYRARLEPVSLLTLVEDDGQLPLESAACEAAREQQRLVEESRAGRAPYGPSTMPDFPVATGHVVVRGPFESEIKDGESAR